MFVFTGDWYIKLIKVTRHLCFKNSKKLHPLDILACNSANKPCFQNTTKSLFPQCSIDVKCYCIFYIYGELGKRTFCQILKRWFISWIELQARMSRGHRYLPFLQHKCLVILHNVTPSYRKWWTVPNVIFN